MTIDPFLDHPELRGKIDTAEDSYFRVNNLRDVMLANPAAASFWHLLHTCEERRASRDAALAGHQGDLWIFAYGSLMWDPALRFDRVLRARAPGHERAFILRDIYGTRGTVEAPGLMAALDAGDGCDGLIFRVPEALITEETSILWRREYVCPGYIPTLIDVDTKMGPVKALAFLADHASEIMVPEITRAEQVRYIATGRGFMGSSLDYVAGIQEQFAAIGIADPIVDDLMKDVLAYRAEAAAVG